MSSSLEPDNRSWQLADRRRVYLDNDEFFKLLKVQGCASSPLAGIILPEPSREYRGWTIERMPADNKEWLKSFQQGFPQLDYWFDYHGFLAHVDIEMQAMADHSIWQAPVVRIKYGPDINRRFPEFWSEVTGLLLAQSTGN